MRQKNPKLTKKFCNVIFFEPYTVSTTRVLSMSFGDIGLSMSFGDIGLSMSFGDIGLSISFGDIGLSMSFGDIGTQVIGLTHCCFEWYVVSHITHKHRSLIVLAFSLSLSLSLSLSFSFFRSVGTTRVLSMSFGDIGLSMSFGVIGTFRSHSVLL